MLLRSLKGAYHASLAYLQKKSIESTINHYDSGVRVDGEFAGFAFCEGFVTPVELPAPRELDMFGMHTTRNIDGSIASIARKAIERFKPQIVDYLGSDCRLDDIVVSWYIPSRARQRGISGSWHDDNCGHRLKLYVCLQGDGGTPTVFLPNSHRRPYKFRMSEFARFFGLSDAGSKPGEVFLRYHAGDIALFDTNGLHRGLYEEPASDRTVIIAEFINRHKANRISGKAPCGPGSAPDGEVHFDSSAYAILAETGLLDPQILRKEGDGYSYSLTNLTAQPALH